MACKLRYRAQEQLLDRGVVYRVETCFHDKYNRNPPVRTVLALSADVAQEAPQAADSEAERHLQPICVTELKDEKAVTRQAKQLHLKRPAMSELAMHGCKRLMSDAGRSCNCKSCF